MKRNSIGKYARTKLHSGNIAFVANSYNQFHSRLFYIISKWLLLLMFFGNLGDFTRVNGKSETEHGYWKMYLAIDKDMMCSFPHIYLLSTRFFFLHENVLNCMHEYAGWFSIFTFIYIEINWHNPRHRVHFVVHKWRMSIFTSHQCWSTTELKLFEFSTLKYWLWMHLN